MSKGRKVGRPALGVNSDKRNSPPRPSYAKALVPRVIGRGSLSKPKDISGRPALGLENTDRTPKTYSQNRSVKRG